MSCWSDWFTIFAFCLEITADIFGRHLYPILTVCLLTTWCKMWSGGKHRSIICRNFAPIFVATFSEYGGLNHVTFPDLFLFLLLLLFPASGSYLKLKSYPLLFNASWYIGNSFLNTSSLDELLLSLLLIPCRNLLDN